MLVRRAKKVCPQEAVVISDFFVSWGRTFKFQKQAYLVSYCVYTAATIELEQIEESDDRDTGAHERLSMILKMLEMEARQTPGIKRSIDIIKARLEGGKTKVEPLGVFASPRPPGPGHPGSLKSQSVKDLESATSHLGFSFSGEGGSSVISDSPMTSQMTFQSPAQDEMTGQSSSVPQTSQHSSQDGPVDLDSSGTAADPAAWMDWSSYNMSGGFVSDSGNWSFYDTPPEMK